MRTYNPDRWVILKFWNENLGTPNVIYKLFAGWYGGYNSSDSWKINSGIINIEREGKAISFTAWTSSIYQVHADSYGTSGYMQSIYQSFVKAIESDTDGNKMQMLTEEEAMEFCRESRTVECN